MNSVINLASSGDSTITAAQGAGKSIRVQGYTLLSGGSSNVRLQAGSDTTGLTGPYPLVAQVGIASGFNLEGWFDLPANTPLVLNNSSGVQISGHVRYVVLG